MAYFEIGSTCKGVCSGWSCCICANDGVKICRVRTFDRGEGGWCCVCHSRITQLFVVLPIVLSEHPSQTRFMT